MRTRTAATLHPPELATGKRDRRAPIAWLAWTLPALAFANVAAYIAYATNPLVSSDAWFFLDAFLRNAMEQGPAIGDFFIKRSTLDHAQPLNKLLLWANAEWFGLDFVVEALMGWVAAAGCYLLMVRDAGRPDGRPVWLHWLGLTALAAALVTLNSGMVFNWSLVALGYVFYLVALLCYWACWRAFAEGRFLPLAATSVLLAASFDEVAVLAGLAAVFTLLIGGARRREKLGNAVKGSLIVLASLGLYALLSRYIIHGAGLSFTAAGASGDGQLLGLWNMRSLWVGMAASILASTLIYIVPLTHYVGAGAVETSQYVLAAAVVLAHLWFWWRALGGTLNRTAFLAIAVMLLFYGLVAGILFGRIASRDATYLNEPRYVLVYLLSNVALLLMWLSQPPARKEWRIGAMLPPAFAMAGLLALQWGLSRYSWYEARFLQSYYHTMARQTLALGAAPSQIPADCVPMLTLCNAPTAVRTRDMEFLRRHRLNIYSPAFIRRYRLEGIDPAGSIPD